MSHYHCFSLFLLAKSGEVSLTLQQVSKLAPFAQVLIYTLMPNGEVVADSRDYPVQRCLDNKVLTRQQENPTEALNLWAQPNQLRLT